LNRRIDAGPAFALLLYIVAASLFFGLRVATTAGLSYVGRGVDPQIFIWSLAWWPHALLHGINPVITHVVWAPDGVNLAWTTSVPGLALLLAPVTLLVGPVAAFNVAAVLMPALAAWTCFLLCRYLTGSLWPSLVGGYLFGFSSYMLGQEEGHLHLTSVFLIPLIALVVVRFLNRELDRVQLSIRLGLLLALQFFLSTEVFFTATLATLFATVIAYSCAPKLRGRLRFLAAPLAGAYLVAFVIASPLVYYAISGFDTHPINQPRNFAADLLNLVVPTKLSLISLRERAFVSHFLGNDSERGAYLGLPVLLTIGLFARRRRSTPEGRFLLICLAVGVLAELGADLRFNGTRLLPLPVSLIDRLPLFDNMLPARLSLFVSLAAAVIVATVVNAGRSSVTRIVLPTLAVVSLLPNLGSHAWITRPDNPRFIANGIYRYCLRRAENTLIFPPGSRGDSMLWQAESGFWFRIAGGYLSPVVPPSFTRFRVAHAALAASSTPRQILMLARAKGAHTIIVDARHSLPWTSLISGRPSKAAGVLLFRLRHSRARTARCVSTSHTVA
jgi:hypothetical protein